MVVTWAYNAGTNTATASGAGSTNFAALVAADVAGGWGKFTADASGTQVKCAAKIVIGDGTNACVFTDTYKQILFIAGTTSAGWQNHIAISANSTLTFGVLSDATYKATNGGCSLTSTDTNYAYMINNSGTTNFYSSQFSCQAGGNVFGYMQNLSGKMYNCIVTRRILIRTPSSVDFYRLTYENMDQTEAIAGPSNCTFNDIILTDVSVDGKALMITTSNGTFSNLTAYNTGVISDGDTAGKTLTLINCTFPSWTFWFTAAYTIYRQYEIDLVVVDSSGTAILDATVTLKKNDATNAFSVSTAADGSISTQTVSRGYYAQATSNTLQDYGPFDLTVSKAGYATYTHNNIVLDEKIDWRISLLTTAEAQALVPSTGGRGGIVYVDREVIKKVEVPTKKEKYALQLCGVLIAQKELMRRQNGE